jgi:hypothetical protein
MSKIVLSGSEFKLLSDKYRAQMEGDFVLWRNFADDIEEVFGKKNLEKSVDIVIGNARTETNYGIQAATAADEQNAGRVRESFTNLVRRQRLDAKSFFQDHDRHNHFKVTPRKFKQIMTLLGISLSEEELNSIVKVY